MAEPSSAIEKASKPDRSALVEELKDHGKILGGSIGLLWVIQAVNAISHYSLNAWGIIPRHLQGLWGILFAPFLHGSWAHLIANTVPFAILGWMVMLRRKRDFFYVAGISGLVAGIGTWLFGGLLAAGIGVHIGASSIIFGFLGYLLSRAVFERKAGAILGAVATMFLFGGAMVGGLVPHEGISWVGHFFGLMGGILAGRMLVAPAEKKPEEKKTPAVRARVAALPSGGDRLRATAKAAPEQDEDIEAELEALRRKNA